MGISSASRPRCRGPGGLLRRPARLAADRVVPGRARLPPGCDGLAHAAPPRHGRGPLGRLRGDLAWFALVGVLGGVSYLAFYRALAIGPISIVSPIVSAYAAVTVVCAVLIGGERLGGGETVAIVVVMLGVVLASSDLAQMRHSSASRSSGSCSRSRPRCSSASSSTASRTSAPSTAGSFPFSWRAASRRSSRGGLAPRR